jgi:lipopolysaccharide biosynthesis glycosyltransferase
MNTSNVSIRLHQNQGLLSEQFNFLYTRAHYSKEMYLRWLIPNAFPFINKCIYLDCDTIIESDIAELYLLNLYEKSFGGVINFKTESFKRHLERDLGLNASYYINSGVLLMDCLKLRTLHFPEKCFAYVREHRQLHCPDQDALNAEFENDIALLPPEWNVQWHHIWNKSENTLNAPDDQLFYQALRNPKIFHYTTNIKPWNNSMRPYANRFWHYARLSPFFSELVSAPTNELNVTDPPPTRDNS